MSRCGRHFLANPLSFMGADDFAHVPQPRIGQIDKYAVGQARKNHYRNGQHVSAPIWQTHCKRALHCRHKQGRCKRKRNNRIARDTLINALARQHPAIIEQAPGRRCSLQRSPVTARQRVVPLQRSRQPSSRSRPRYKTRAVDSCWQAWKLLMDTADRRERRPGQNRHSTNRYSFWKYVLEWRKDEWQSVPKIPTGWPISKPAPAVRHLSASSSSPWPRNSGNQFSIT
jgi:hypothetical protein